MTSDLARILGRLERPAPLGPPIARLRGDRVLVTGADGSIGSAIERTLRAAGVDVIATDLAPHERALDVRSPEATLRVLRDVAPSVVLHLAGEKHAPDGELDPQGVCQVNSVGTLNVVNAATQVGARVVTVSTCKACDPETAYGFSKALAERITLAAGGSVARLYNVVETVGNVFELWAATPADQPLRVMPCERYFVSLAEAVSLIVWTAVLPAGRYMVDPGMARSIPRVAADLHPNRDRVFVDPRRGDRIVEPRYARSEAAEKLEHGLVRVSSVHETAVLPRWESAA